jgi:hypothetical protein
MKNKRILIKSEILNPKFETISNERNSNVQIVKGFTIILICLNFSIFNRLTMANFPTCLPCYEPGPYGCSYTCNQSDCKWCVNGSCQQCGGNQDQFCCNGGCCVESLCQECVDGGCWECGRRPCEHCVDGHCESHCNAAECQRCVDGRCRGCDPILEMCCPKEPTGECYDGNHICCNGKVYDWPEYECCRDGTNEWPCNTYNCKDCNMTTHACDDRCKPEKQLFTKMRLVEL